jgi:dihydroorotate dehydrogenase (fumarate)
MLTILVCESNESGDRLRELHRMNLATRYMGLELKNPLIASASPLTGELGNIRQLEDSGAAAIVLPSIFEEQIEAQIQRCDHLISVGSDSSPEALSYFPQLASYRVGPDHYLDLINRAVEAVAIPIIASLNATTDEGWIGYAKPGRRGRRQGD